MFTEGVNEHSGVEVQKSALTCSLTLEKHKWLINNTISSLVRCVHSCRTGIKVSSCDFNNSKNVAAKEWEWKKEQVMEEERGETSSHFRQNNVGYVEYIETFVFLPSSCSLVSYLSSPSPSSPPSLLPLTPKFGFCLLLTSMHN